MRWLTISSFILCLIAAGLGTLWYFSASWIAIIFAVLFGLVGIGLFAVTFIIAEKIELFNTLASGALSIYDATQSSGKIVETEEELTTQPTSNQRTPLAIDSTYSQEHRP